MAKYRIIAFDGGGIQRLNDLFPDLIGMTDLFAGTSTGSFIALGLSYGLSPDDLVDLYSEERGRFIFTPRYLDIIRPRYNNRHLAAVLYSVFPAGLRLKDYR